jgi:hypothetical protein
VETQRSQRSNSRVSKHLSCTHCTVLTQVGDLSKASAKIKSEIPGQTKKAEKETEKVATEAGAKVDSYVSHFRQSILSLVDLFQESLTNTSAIG